MRLTLSRALDIVLVGCAVFTAWAVGQHLSASTSRSDGASAFEGWKEDLDFGRSIGPDDTPYRIVVWMDYQCPACRYIEGQLELARHELHDSLRVIYRHSPLDGHPLAFKAAVAAECARAQGRFPEMHNALFADGLKGDSLPLTTLRARAGINDTTSFASCLSDPRSAAIEAVRADLTRVRTLGVRGTPGLQIGDHLAAGTMSAAELVEGVREAAGIFR